MEVVAIDGGAPNPSPWTDLSLLGYPRCTDAASVRPDERRGSGPRRIGVTAYRIRPCALRRGWRNGGPTAEKLDGRPVSLERNIYRSLARVIYRTETSTPPTTGLMLMAGAAENPLISREVVARCHSSSASSALSCVASATFF